MHWHNPARFHRVCPLLVQHEGEFRCSANTADVRPFWGRAAKYYGGTAFALYAVAVITVFGVLRTIGYPISIVHVAFPPSWHRVGQARGWFFLLRSRESYAAGRANEGFLYLTNAYEFDPANYEVGLALARACQISRIQRSDEVFAQLLRDHPNRRSTTAQNWFRALIARGDFSRISQLAYDQVLNDPRFAGVWVRALVFSTRQSGDAALLRQLAGNTQTAALKWRRLLETELLVRSRRTDAAIAALKAPWSADEPRETVVYRVETLVRLGHASDALEVLERERPRIDGEAWLTLRLDALASAGARQSAGNEFERYLLGVPLTQPGLKVMCAHLIRHPDKDLFDRLKAKVENEQMNFNDGTAGGWFSLLCVAGAAGDLPQLRTYTQKLSRASEIPFAAFIMVEAFFRGTSTDRRATSFLPYLPVPLEVTYALIDRYPGMRPTETGSGVP